MLTIFGGVILVCTAAFIGILSSLFAGYVVVPGDSIWMLVVSVLSIGGFGYFAGTQGAARNPEYVPTLLFLVMGIIFSILWFTAAVSLAAVSLTFCGDLSVYAGYYGATLSPSVTGICAAGGLADAFSWLSFIGSVVFTLTIFGVGSRAGAWSSVGQNFQMGVVPPQQPAYGYPQQQYPQQQYPQQQYAQSPPPMPAQAYQQSPPPQQQQLYGEVRSD